MYHILHHTHVVRYVLLKYGFAIAVFIWVIFIASMLTQQLWQVCMLPSLHTAVVAGMHAPHTHNRLM